MDKRYKDNGCRRRMCPAKKTCKRSNGNFHRSQLLNKSIMDSGCMDNRYKIKDIVVTPKTMDVRYEMLDVG